MFEEVHLFYIVCDESGSTGPNSGIATINQALPQIHEALACDPFVADRIRLSIIAFSDNAEVILPLCKVTDVADMPSVTQAGLANYGIVFALLQTTIENDVNYMKSQGFRVHRPLVFFISSGEPLDIWEPAYQGLANHAYHPNIVGYGVDDADPVILAKIATARCYVGRHIPPLGKALTNELALIFPNLYWTGFQASIYPDAW